MKVLHIEDRKENRTLVRKVLESKGHVVHDAVDGLHGLELARHLSVDLILVDINIPSMNGYEVVTRLKADPEVSPSPIVAITAEGDRDRALALGFDGFIAKPIRATTFEVQITEYVDGYRETVEDSVRSLHLEQHTHELVNRLESRVRELEKVNGRLREVDRLKLAVLRNVSHELATPMTPICGYLKMLQGEELGPVTPGQSKVLERMEHSTLRLQKMIDNLLAATRFASGSRALETECFSPEDLIAVSVDECQAQADEKQVSIEVLHTVSLVVFADRAQCQAAITHLLENAIKFGPVKGLIQIRSWTETVNQDAQKNWVLSISDEGPGIPVDEREHVVQPFYQSDSSPTRLHGGAGLGLAIASRAAASHGGSLMIREADHGGGLVIYRIPLQPGSPYDHQSSGAS